jgi:pimeloyl-ACP methyl ester carboxylesterase
VCPCSEPYPHSSEDKRLRQSLISLILIGYDDCDPVHHRRLRSKIVTTTPSSERSATPNKWRRRGRRTLLVGGLLAVGAAAGVARRRLAASGGEPYDDERHALGWGEGVTRPDHQFVRTHDGAELAVWDLPGDGLDAPVVVLPHCWGCSHEIWIPVARRLREQGHRVVLYDQRGHGLSTRGTAPLAIDTLAHDLEAVLEATDVRDVVLSGHSMGGFTVMSLATHRPEVFQERAKAVVLVATAATAVGLGGPATPEFAAKVISSPFATRALKSRNGHLLVRSTFGAQPVRAHMELTRDIFANCDPSVRGDQEVRSDGRHDSGLQARHAQEQGPHAPARGPRRGHRRDRQGGQGLEPHPLQHQSPRRPAGAMPAGNSRALHGREMRPRGSGVKVERPERSEDERP